MDRENIFALARENGATSREAERFCEIVAAEVAKEREACATICEPTWNRPGGNAEAIREWDVRKDLSAIIRMRSNVLADRREPIGEASSPKGDGRAAG